MMSFEDEAFQAVNTPQLTSTVNGENPGSRPRWSMRTSWTTTQSDNRALLSIDNSGLSWTVSAPDKVTAVPVRRNGNFQTPISVPAVRPKWRHTLSNPAHWQDYTVACLNYTLQTMMPLPGWPVMAPKCIRQQQQYTSDVAYWRERLSTVTQISFIALTSRHNQSTFALWLVSILLTVLCIRSIELIIINALHVIHWWLGRLLLLH